VFLFFMKQSLIETRLTQEVHLPIFFNTGKHVFLFVCSFKQF
jgi:hypothetical protein